MAIDLRTFRANNVADTCAVWNVVSSLLFQSEWKRAGCHFCIAEYVEHECLTKPRARMVAEDQELQRRLNKERIAGGFKTIRLDAADLLQVQVLESRKRLGKGELASIAVAQRLGLSILTDDGKARKLAAEVLPSGHVQTTPHLFGWLVFQGRISDSEKSKIVREHTESRRPLGKVLEDVFLQAMEWRLRDSR